jgi:hypothetical protein
MTPVFSFSDAVIVFTRHSCLIKTVTADFPAKKSKKHRKAGISLRMAGQRC